MSVKVYGEDGYTNEPLYYKCQECGDYVELDDKVYWVQKDNKWECEECAWNALEEYFKKEVILSTFFPSQIVTEVGECREML